LPVLPEKPNEKLLYLRRAGRLEAAGPARLQKMGGKKMTEALKRALKHEQNLNEQLRERVMELETENKTLILQLQAKYAGEVDDN
jgi:hypothetical protein